MDIVTIRKNSEGKKQQIRLIVSEPVVIKSKWKRVKDILKKKLKFLDPRPDFDDL
jgi:hypothetical protein